MEWIKNLKITEKCIILGFVLSILFLLSGLSGIFSRNLPYSVALILNLIITLLLSFITILLLIISSLKIKHSYSKLTEKMNLVAEKNVPIEFIVVDVKSNDEIGKLNKAFNHMVYRLTDLINSERLLRQVILASICSINYQHTLKTIVTETGKALNADRCFFAEYDAKKGMFSPLKDYEEYTSSPDIKPVLERQYTKEEVEVFRDQALLQKKILDVYDINQLELPAATKHMLIEDYKVKSYAVVPVYYMNNPLGSFVLHYVKDYKRLSPDEIDLLKAIAYQAGIIIYQAKLFNNIQEAKNRENLLRSIITTIRESLDLEIVLKSICSEILKIFQADRVAVWNFNKESNYTKWANIQEVKSNPNIMGVLDFDYPAEVKKFVGLRVLDDDQNIIIDNIEETNCPDFFTNVYKYMDVKSLIVLPVKKENDKWGLLFLTQVNHYRHWTEDEIELLHTISDQIYIAIRQAELYTSIKNYAEREQLLRTINNIILSSTSLEDALKNITAEIGKLVPVQRVCISIYDPQLKSFSNIIGEYRSEENIPTTKGITISTPEYNDFMHSLFIEQKKNFLVIENIDTAPIPETIRNLLKSIHVISTTIFPILYQNKLIGMISLSSIKSPNLIKKQDIDLVLSIIQQMGLGINLLQTADKLNISLEREKTVRELFMGARKLVNHDQVFNYLLEQLAGIFGVERALHLHIDSNKNLLVYNEFLANQNYGVMINQSVLNAENTVEMVPKAFEEIVVISDVEREITNIYLKEYLIERNIKAFIVYPLATKPIGQKQIQATCMICSSHPRKWTSDEITTLRLAVDTISLVYFEIRQRKESEDAKNTFIAMLTHDLRSPINAEQKALEAILSQKFGTSLDNFAEFLQDIHKTNEDLLRIVNNLLTVYHYESGKFELSLKPTSLEDIIYDSIRSVKSLAEDQQATIIIDIQPDLPKIMIDQGEISRVIGNLLNNAIKHTRRGTGIILSARKTDNNIEVSVHDNGSGIAESERNKIFQRYPTEKRKIGTGLGLYLSKQIIDAHKGKIWFDTETGKGTTFYFTLPVQ